MNLLEKHTVSIFRAEDGDSTLMCLCFVTCAILAPAQFILHYKGHFFRQVPNSVTLKFCLFFHSFFHT
jgi:hypothetical protein